MQNEMLAYNYPNPNNGFFTEAIVAGGENCKLKAKSNYK